MKPLRLAWVTEPATCRLPLADVARAAADGGADAVIVRGLLTDLAATEAAARLVEVLAGTPMRVLVSGRFDIALAAGAHGVHLKDDGLSPRDVRAAVASAGAPPSFVIGASVHDGERLGVVATEGAGHATLGPLRDAHGSPGRGEAFLGAALEAARARGPLPSSVLLLGGIHDGDGAVALRLARAGETIGLAAIRMFQDAATPSEVTARARRALAGLVRGGVPS